MVMIKDMPAVPLQGVATCKCSRCGREGVHKMAEDECRMYMKYRIKGHAMGEIKDLFPQIPLWIAVGAIDPISDGESICPDCSKNSHV